MLAQRPLETPKQSLYTPSVPSPLNPLSSRPSSLGFPLAPTSGPKPKHTSSIGSKYNISPTQRLLRQKAKEAWQSQTRLNILLSATCELGDAASYHSPVAPGGRGNGVNLKRAPGHERRPRVLGHSGGYRHPKSQRGRRHGKDTNNSDASRQAKTDIMLHPNMIAFMENLDGDKPVVIAAPSSLHPSTIPSSAPDNDLEAPEIAEGDIINLDRSLNHDAKKKQQRRRHKPRSYSSTISWSTGEEEACAADTYEHDRDTILMDDKDYTTVFIPTFAVPSSPVSCPLLPHEKGECEDEDEKLVVYTGPYDPLLRGLRHRPAQEEGKDDFEAGENKRTTVLTSRHLLILVAVVVMLCLYPVLRLYPELVRKTGTEYA